MLTKILKCPLPKMANLKEGKKRKGRAIFPVFFFVLSYPPYPAPSPRNPPDGREDLE